MMWKGSRGRTKHDRKRERQEWKNKRKDREMRSVISADGECDGKRSMRGTREEVDEKEGVEYIGKSGEKIMRRKGGRHRRSK